MFKKLKIIKQFLKTRNFYDKDELEKYKSKKLHNLLRSLKSEFYPKSINLQDYFIINKKIFMENFESINTRNITYKEACDITLKAEKTRNFSPTLKDVTLGLSSGTSHSKGIFLVSENESALWAGYILKRMLPRPLLQKHKIAFFLRANSNLYETINSKMIRFSFYDLLIPITEHIKNLNETKPTILIAPASVLRILAKQRDLDINPKKIISVAEVLEDDDRLIIEERFNQIVHQVYQCTEGFLAHTCKYGHLHLNEDIVHIEKEWLDSNKTRFSPIITDYNRTTQPVIRYKLDDILVIDNDFCECGSVFQRIKKIEGRCDDILKMTTKDGESYDLFPDFVRGSIISVDGIQEYRVEKKENELYIYLKPLILKNEVDKALYNLYERHQLKSLNHIFLEYKDIPLDKKRRRVSQI